ncbi:MAG: hypothetical protein ABFC34_11415 [Methanobacterium sp.]
MAKRTRKKVINGREVLIYSDVSKKRRKSRLKKIIFANKELWDWSEETSGLKKEEKILHFLFWSIILSLTLFIDIFHIRFLGPRGGPILLALLVYFFTGLLWSIGLWKYPSQLWRYLKSLRIDIKYKNMEKWLEKKIGVQFFWPGGRYTSQAYIVETSLFFPIYILLMFLILPKNTNGMLFLSMLTVWLFYPLLVMLIRLNTFSEIGLKNSGGKGYDPTFFWIYSFIIGLFTTIGSMILYSLLFQFSENSIEAAYIILLTLIVETVILLPDKLEPLFKTDLRTSLTRETIAQFIKKTVYIFMGSLMILLTLLKLIQFLIH